MIDRNIVCPAASPSDLVAVIFLSNIFLSSPPCDDMSSAYRTMQADILAREPL